MERAFGIYQSPEEAYADWSQKWALALAYGVTQDQALAEKSVGEALVGALVSRPSVRSTGGAGAKGAVATVVPAASVLAHHDLLVDFATRVLRSASPRTFRGFSSEEFFKLPIITRAAVMLKVKGRFSRAQTARVLGVSDIEAERLLESARLAFTRGRPWLVSGGFRQLEDARLVAPCPNPEDGRLYARYLEHDLTSDETVVLHRHFVACTLCRGNLVRFKNVYNDWLFSLPEPEVNKAAQNVIKKTIALGIKARREHRTQVTPSPWPGLRRVLADRQTQLLLLSLVAFLWLLKAFLG